jgi:hypothetical protein
MELPTMVEAALANGPAACAAIAQGLGGLRWATIGYSDSRILTMQSAGGLKAGHAGLHLCALG